MKHDITNVLLFWISLALLLIAFPNRNMTDYTQSGLHYQVRYGETRCITFDSLAVENLKSIIQREKRMLKRLEE